jgi:hypothetical protein
MLESLAVSSVSSSATAPTLARQVLVLYSVELAEARFPDLDLSALLYRPGGAARSGLESERVEAELAYPRHAVAVTSVTRAAAWGTAEHRAYARRL